MPNGALGTAYNQNLTQSGGSGTITWSISAGALPGGLLLNTATGVLSGTPNAAGNFNFTIKATDANGCMGTRAYSVTVTGVVVNSGLQFYPLPRPVRLLDTRAGQGNCDSVGMPIAGGASLTTLARLTCEGITIPSTAQAITGNLTIINQSGQTGYLTIYPDGQNAPLAANMIYGPDAILSNNFTVGLSSDGRFNIFAERTPDAVVDISGYYAPPGAGGLYYHPLSKPVRLLDTRANQGNCDNVSTPIPAGTSITTLARVSCDGVTIPATAQAIVGNATVINGSGQTGYLTIYPNGVAAPLAANLIYFPGQILSNAFTVSLNASGEFNIFGERTIDIAIDVAGYYSNEALDANGAGLLLTPLARPLRILDTRANQGNCDNISRLFKHEVEGQHALHFDRNFAERRWREGPLARSVNGGGAQQRVAAGGIGVNHAALFRNDYDHLHRPRSARGFGNRRISRLWLADGSALQHAFGNFGCARRFHFRCWCRIGRGLWFRFRRRRNRIAISAPTSNPCLRTATTARDQSREIAGRSVRLHINPGGFVRRQDYA